MNWLQFCLEKLQAGRENDIPLDPFHNSKRRIMTSEYIDKVIEVIDAEFEYEETRFSQFHQQHSGSSKPPNFARLKERGRRAMVQGIDRILSF